MSLNTVLQNTKEWSMTAKKSKMQLAIEKTKDIDKKEFSDFEDTINDGM